MLHLILPENNNTMIVSLANKIYNDCIKKSRLSDSAGGIKAYDSSEQKQIMKFKNLMIKNGYEESTIALYDIPDRLHKTYKPNNNQLDNMWNLVKDNWQIMISKPTLVDEFSTIFPPNLLDKNNSITRASTLLYKWQAKIMRGEVSLKEAILGFQKDLIENNLMGNASW
jgi:hypothetical protein